MLIGVIAPTPGPTTGVVAAQAPTKKLALPAPPSAGTPVQPTAAPEEKIDPRGEKPKAEPKAEEAPPAKVETAPKAEEGGGGDDDSRQTMSKEALLDLFSNPDLIKSLQE